MLVDMNFVKKISHMLEFNRKPISVWKSSALTCFEKANSIRTSAAS